MSSCSMISPGRRMRPWWRSPTRSAPRSKCGTSRFRRCPTATVACGTTPAGMATRRWSTARSRSEDLADDLAGLLDALGVEQAHIVGLSLGGMTAPAFGVRHSSRAESLVLMATSAYLPHSWDERAATVRSNGMGAIVDAVLARWFTPDFASAHPEAVAPLRDRFLANNPQGYAACCEAILDMDLRASNAALWQPTLIVAGADDPATPVAMMEDIRTRVPQAELVVLPQAAHILAVERPEAVNRHLAAFLDDLMAPR